MKKYYSGQNKGDTIVLHRRVGTKKIEERITKNQFGWYFCVRSEDVKKYKRAFTTMVKSGMVERITQDDSKEYARIYCHNRNIWHENPGEDQKRLALEEMARLGIQTYEADLTSLDRYMVDSNIQIDDQHKIGYFDIETKDTAKEILVGSERILSIAIVDDEGNEICICERNEADLLRKAFHIMKKFTVLCTWNGEMFDWPYLKQRAKVWGINFALWDVNHIDLMKWFDKAVQAGSIKDKPKSKKLADVAEQYLGSSKTAGVMGGHGRIYKLFMTNPALLKEYNIQDCRLLKMFDEYFQATKQVVKACQICGTFPGRSSNTSLTDKFLLRLARKEYRRIVTRIHNRRKAGVKPPGGRVFIKKRGVYNKILGFDFSGYYNSIMRYLNVGPDTIMTYKDLENIPRKKRPYIPLAVSPYTYLNNVFMKQLRKYAVDDGCNVTMKKRYVEGFQNSKTNYLIFEGEDKENIEALIREVYNEFEKKFTLAWECFQHYFFKIRGRKGQKRIIVEPRCPVFFRHDFESINVQALNLYTSERNKWKVEIKKLRAEGVDPESAQMKRAELMSNTYKLLGNIVYGQAAAVHSRIYHFGAPPSITLFAQLTTNMTKRWFEDHGAEVVYMDTDSNYVYMPDYTEDKFEELKRAFEEDYHPYIRGMIQKYFKISPKRKCPIKLEFEKVWKRMFLYKKKMYAGVLEWETGKGNVNNITFKGLKLVRRETVSFAKKVQQKLLDIVLRSREVPTEKQLWHWVKKLKSKFFSMKWTDDNIHYITKRTTIRKAPEDYKGSSANKVEIRIVKRMFERGDHFDLGGMLAWVIVKSEGKQKQGEEIRFFLKNGESINLEIDVDEYWNKDIFKPLFRICATMYPKLNWMLFDTDDGEKQKKKYEQQLRLVEKKDKREQRLNIIMGYKKFSRTQRTTLLKKILELQKEQWPDSELIPKIENYLTLVEDGTYDSWFDDE